MVTFWKSTEKAGSSNNNFQILKRRILYYCESPRRDIDDSRADSSPLSGAVVQALKDLVFRNSNEEFRPYLSVYFIL
jgi:hypothetical protein